jgi:hypothetical protein
VDLRGFEPLTSSVRLRRAPNCATGPFSRRMTFYLRGMGMSSKLQITFGCKIDISYLSRQHMTDSAPQSIYRITNLHESDRPRERLAAHRSAGADQCRVDRHPGARGCEGRERGHCGKTPAQKIWRVIRPAPSAVRRVEKPARNWRSQGIPDQGRHRVGTPPHVGIARRAAPRTRWWAMLYTV